MKSDKGTTIDKVVLFPSKGALGTMQINEGQDLSISSSVSVTVNHTPNAVSWRYSEEPNFVGKDYQPIPLNDMKLPVYKFEHVFSGYDGEKELFVQISDKDGIENIISDTILLDRQVPEQVNNLSWLGPFVGGSGTATWKLSVASSVKQMDIQLYEGSACGSLSGESLDLLISDESKIFTGLNPLKIYSYRIFALTTNDLPYASPCSSAGSAIVPTNLVTFTGSTSSNDFRSVSLSLEFPPGNDYAKIEIYKKPGLTPPSTCSGDLVATVTDFSTALTIADQQSDQAVYQRYSYRACITSQVGLVNSADVTSGHYPSIKSTYEEGGFDWYAGALGETCAEVCADKGGYNAATKDYAGGDGILANAKIANCNSVLNGLWAPRNGNLPSTINWSSGCVFASNGERYIGYFATTDVMSTFGMRRACACGI